MLRDPWIEQQNTSYQYHITIMKVGYRMGIQRKHATQKQSNGWRQTLAAPRLSPASATSSLALGDVFFLFFHSKWHAFSSDLTLFWASLMSLAWIMPGVICSPLADHFASSLAVYIQEEFIGKRSFNFGWRLVWVELFNTLPSWKSFFCCKMFVTFVMYKIMVVSVIRNKAWEYILCCCLFGVATANI